MKNYLILLFTLLLFSACQTETEKIQIKGELKQWHKITLLIDGPKTSENAAENPFLDYRLDVIFSNGDKQLTVPGFYVADGNAAETSASEGNKWAVRFRPDQAGEWNYSVSFQKAKNIAVNENTAVAETVAGDGASGSFTVAATDKQSPDLRAGGRVFYDGGH
jgi:hypothetical protein